MLNKLGSINEDYVGEKSLPRYSCIAIISLSLV